MNALRSLQAATACVALACTAAVSAHDVAFGQTRATVQQRIGAPALAWSSGLCPARTQALYRRPGMLMKLVFDEQDRLAVVSVMATRRGSPQGAPAIGWPGLAPTFAVPQPPTYAQWPGAAPWFHNVGAQELDYYERAAASGQATTYIGSVVLGDVSAFAWEPLPPADAAAVSTQLALRGRPVSTTPDFAALRRWRTQARPNVLIRVALGATPTSPHCDGFALGRIGQPDLALLN
jgi:hypothetical protein